MKERPGRQSFAHVLASADGGLLDRQLSEAFADLNDELDDRSMTMDGETVKGEITIKLKVANTAGKVDIKADCIVKKPPTKYTGARFWRDEDGNLSTQDPRVVGDLFSQKRAEKATQGRSAAAPKTAGEKVGG